MKIIFLNVWGGTTKKALVDYLKHEAQTTDIFCFQEATDAMKQLCADVLLDYTEIADYKYVSDNDDFPQSIFIKNNLEIISSATLLVENMNTGLALYVEIKTENGSLFVCNVHGIAQPGDKLDSDGRIRQSSQLIDFFKDIQQPVIIGGDFNIRPDTASIRMFAENGYENLIEKHNVDTTRNHLAWDRFPVKQYYSDYVMLNKSVRYKTFTVPKNEVSDHLPLVLELEI